MERLVVRAIEGGDRAEWEVLWDGYTRFYGREPSAALSEITWSRVVDPTSAVAALVALDERGRVVGIANYVVHESTSHRQPVCYLQDLFVAPDVRGRGAGRRLIDTLIAAMPERGWARLYWNTRADNHAARALYDTYTLESGFLRYVIDAP